MARVALVLAVALALPAVPSAQAPCEGGQAFDDGTAELHLPPGGTYHGPGVDHLVSRFTPPSYPYVYERVCLNLESFGFDYPNGRFAVVVFDDDSDPRFNDPGDPGTLLGEVPVQMALTTTPRWISVDLGCGLPVTSGSVWIGVRWSRSDNDLQVGLDKSRQHPYRYSLDAVFWGPSVGGETGALLVRALGAPGDGAALAQPRNGSGVNPLVYSADPPRIGTTWSARVDHSSQPGTRATQIQLFAGGTSGFLLPQGELLVDLTTPRLFVSSRVSSGTIDVHTAAIPPDVTLVGLTAASQALLLAPGSVVLCNAVDLRVGC